MNYVKKNKKGEFIKSSSEYQHECSSSLPSQFEVLSSFDKENKLSLIVFYECPLDVTPLFALSSSSSSDLQIIPLSVSFTQSNPSLTKWKFNQNSVSSSLTISAQYCKVYDVTINSKSKSVSITSKRNECPIIDDKELKYRGKIKNIWKSNNGNSNSMGILNDDGSLCYVGNNGKIDWCRDEALALPLKVYLFDETQDESSLCSEDMKEEECEAAYNAPFPSFPVRLANDIATTLTLSGFDVNELIRKLNTFFPISSAWLEDTFEKIITILTQSGTVFGLSSTTGNKLWSINLKFLCERDDNDNGNDIGNYQIVTMLSIRQHPPHLLAILTDKVLKKSKIISISSPFHTTQTPHIHVEGVNFIVKNAFITPWLTKDHSDKIVVLISDNNAINVYPSNEQKSLSSNLNSIFYQTLSLQEQSISGYNLDLKKNKKEILSSELWRKSFLDSDKEIVDVVFSSRDQYVVNSVYRTGERGAIYKYLNPHLIGIATIDKKQNMLNVYLIDGITGRVYIHQYHQNVDIYSGGISLLLYENKFIYTYFNQQTLLQEITSIDLWSSDPSSVPTKGRTPSEGYIVGENPLGDDNIFSSFNSPLPNPTYQAYNFMYSIDKLLCVSNTRYSVSNKWILAKLSSGSIIQIDSKWLNTRRPINHEPTQSNKEEQLIPYKKYIPFNNFWTLSQEYTLNRINNAISIGSPIESTSIFLGYGQLDYFYTTLKPSKNFDTIPPDFDYAMLALILSGVCIAIFVAKQMVQSKKIKKEWK